MFTASWFSFIHLIEAFLHKLLFYVLSTKSYAGNQLMCTFTSFLNCKVYQTWNLSSSCSSLPFLQGCSGGAGFYVALGERRNKINNNIQNWSNLSLSYLLSIERLTAPELQFHKVLRTSINHH